MLTPVWGLWKCGHCGEYKAGEPVAYSTAGPVCGLCQTILWTSIPQAMIDESKANFYSAREDYRAYKETQGLEGV